MNIPAVFIIYQGDADGLAQDCIEIDMTLDFVPRVGERVLLNESLSPIDGPLSLEVLQISNSYYPAAQKGKSDCVVLVSLLTLGLEGFQYLSEFGNSVIFVMNSITGFDVCWQL